MQRISWAQPAQVFVDGKPLVEVSRTEQNETVLETGTEPLKPGRSGSSAYCGQNVPAIDVSLLIDMDPAVKPERVGAQAAVP